MNDIIANSMVGLSGKANQVSESDFAISESLLPIKARISIVNDRRKAWQIYKKLPFPSTKDEAWSRTSLGALEKSSFQFDFDQQKASDISDDIVKPVIEGKQAGRLIIQPGKTSVYLDDKYKSAGVVLDDLFKINNQKPPVFPGRVNNLIHPEDGKFAALACALAQHGTFLYVPKGVKITEPLHSLFWNDNDHSAVCSRNILWIEDDAEATFVQEFASDNKKNHTQFHAGILEVYVGVGAKLQLVELQSWGKEVWNIMHEKVTVAQDGNLSWIFGSLGSKLTKSFSSVDLAGRGAVAKVSGFYFADGFQHLDMDTEQNHLMPDTTSDLLYKGAVTGSARSVWQGNILVAKGANGTDGYQANRNLILSRDARADSIPGLEILADDVKCTHGATVGKVDAEQLFYLRSRGLKEFDARHLIVEGFFEPIMERIPFRDVQERFRTAIFHKIDAED